MNPTRKILVMLFLVTNLLNNVVHAASQRFVTGIITPSSTKTLKTQMEEKTGNVLVICSPRIHSRIDVIPDTTFEFKLQLVRTKNSYHYKTVEMWCIASSRAKQQRQQPLASIEIRRAIIASPKLESTPESIPEPQQEVTESHTAQTLAIPESTATDSQQPVVSTEVVEPVAEIKQTVVDTTPPLTPIPQEKEVGKVEEMKDEKDVSSRDLISVNANSSNQDPSDATVIFWSVSFVLVVMLITLLPKIRPTSFCDDRSHRFVGKIQPHDLAARKKNCSMI